MRRGLLLRLLLVVGTGSGTLLADEICREPDGPSVARSQHTQRSQQSHEDRDERQQRRFRYSKSTLLHNDWSSEDICSKDNVTRIAWSRGIS